MKPVTKSLLVVLLGTILIVGMALALNLFVELTGLEGGSGRGSGEPREDDFLLPAPSLTPRPPAEETR